MKQMNVEESMKINVDFSAAGLPAIVKKLEPLVFKDGNAYCCVFGADPQEGIFGCGDSPGLALVDWEANLANRLATSSAEDPAGQYIKDLLKAADGEVW